MKRLTLIAETQASQIEPLAGSSFRPSSAADSLLASPAPSSSSREMHSLCSQFERINIVASSTLGLSSMAPSSASRSLHSSAASQYLMRTTRRRGITLQRFMINMFPRKLFYQKNKYIRNVVRSYDMS